MAAGILFTLTPAYSNSIFPMSSSTLSNVGISDVLPLGQWQITVDLSGNEIDPGQTKGKAYRQSVYYFKPNNEYEFSMNEFDATGNKTAMVTEAGRFTSNENSFVLQPKSSSSVLYDGTSLKGSNSTTTKNSLTAVTYSWQAIQVKDQTISSITILPKVEGFREGNFSSSKAKTAASGGRPLSAVRATVRAL